LREFFSTGRHFPHRDALHVLRDALHVLRDALHMLYLQPMNLASDYHPWASLGAVDNTLSLYAHAGLWKVEDFLYRAAIATTRSIEMLCTCYTSNQGTWPLNIIHRHPLELYSTHFTCMLMLVSGKLRTFSTWQRLPRQVA
jgi:hypothetical protein